MGNVELSLNSNKVAEVKPEVGVNMDFFSEGGWLSRWQGRLEILFWILVCVINFAKVLNLRKVTQRFGG